MLAIPVNVIEGGTVEKAISKALAPGQFIAGPDGVHGEWKFGGISVPGTRADVAKAREQASNLLEQLRKAVETGTDCR